MAEKKHAEKKAKKESHKAEKHAEKPREAKAPEEEEKHSAKEKHAEAKKHAKPEEKGHSVKKESHAEAKEEQAEGPEIKEEPAEGPASEERTAKKHRPEKPKRGKPSVKSFVELKPQEILEAIVHLANEGHSMSEIGMMLRDQYGIPKVDKVVGKKLGVILSEKNLLPEMPEDLMNLIRKSVILREHLARNKKDMSAKHGLMLTVAKIRALEKYYKRKGKMPLQWRYSPETAALLAK